MCVRVWVRIRTRERRRSCSVSIQRVDFIASMHKRTARNYLERVTSHDKAACAVVAQQWGYDYWDGERCYGYGGMRYDGRWRPFAEKFAAHYGLTSGMRVLDIGCGKGYLLYELTQVIPGLEVVGLDVSAYALEHAKEEIRDRLVLGDATCLPFESGSFDLVYSIITLHNLPLDRLIQAVQEIVRVGKTHRYLCVESFRNEQEKVNLLYWQLTCQSFFSPEVWEYVYRLAGYSGDTDYIYFE